MNKTWMIYYEVNKFRYNDEYENALFLKIMERTEIPDDEIIEEIDMHPFFKDEVLQELEDNGELHDYHWDCQVEEVEEFQTEKEAEERFKELIDTKKDWLKKYILLNE
jgi:Ni,Fe-hydrogenase maturation factor|tara:strand:+ start:1281 stop:1604 length:324 start_codon:yes stop_codon:yes gene_type:complete